MKTSYVLEMQHSWVIKSKCTELNCVGYNVCHTPQIQGQDGVHCIPLHQGCCQQKGESVALY